MQSLKSPAEQYSSLSRILDPFTYPTHRIVLGGSLLAGAAAGLFNLLGSDNLGGAILAGLNTGAIAFIAWVLTRELDPDDNRAALIALFLSAVAALAMGAPGFMFLSSALLIMIVRIVNRTVGPAARLSDSIIILALGAAAAFVDFWGMALALALAFGLDAALEPPHRLHRWFAGLALVAAAAAFVQAGAGFSTQISGAALAILVLCTLFFWTIWGTRSVQSPCDRPGYALSVRRVQAGMLLVAAAALLAVMIHENAVPGLLPAYGAMAGVIAARLARAAGI